MTKTDHQNDQNRSPELNSATDVIQMLLKYGVFLQREGNRVFEKHGIKHQQFIVLNEIVSRGPISQKELVEELLFEKSNVSKIVQILQKKGFITVTGHPSDRRVTLLLETEHGEQVWKNCIQAFQAWSSALTAALVPQDIKQAARSLKKFQKLFKNVQGSEK